MKYIKRSLDEDDDDNDNNDDDEKVVKATTNRFVQYFNSCTYHVKKGENLDYISIFSMQFSDGQLTDQTIVRLELFSLKYINVFFT